MLAFVVHHQLIGLIIRDDSKKLKYFLKSIQWHARLGLKVLGVKVIQSRPSEIKGKLLVANHLSYIDVLILFANYPSLFITSVEIKETFLLGRITQLAGCFFVERRKSRRNHSTMLKEIQEIKTKLISGFNIFLFPEGTSSNGEGVLPFKAAFFQTAVETQTPVLPLCVRYSSDAVPWFGDMNFPGHLLKLCSLGGFEAKLTELDLIPVAQDMDRFKLRDLSYEQINECYAKN